MGPASRVDVAGSPRQNSIMMPAPEAFRDRFVNILALSLPSSFGTINPPMSQRAGKLHLSIQSQINPCERFFDNGYQAGHQVSYDHVRRIG